MSLQGAKTFQTPYAIFLGSSHYILSHLFPFVIVIYFHIVSGIKGSSKLQLNDGALPNTYSINVMLFQMVTAEHVPTRVLGRVTLIYT